MTIGEMTSVGIMYIIVATPTDTGGFMDSFTEVATGVRGKLTKQRASRTLEPGVFGINKTWKWECYFTTVISGNGNARQKNRWVIDGKVFTVIDYENVDNKKFYYEFILTEAD